MVLEQFPQLSLMHSDKYGDNFACSGICPVCNKEHKNENLQGRWGDGEYFGEKTYRLACWEFYHREIPIVIVKDNN